MNDLKFACRQLLKNPGFTIVAVLTLALGIGANTAIFSIVRAMLIEPLPYRDSNRLIFVWLDRSEVRYPRAPLSSPDLHDLREHSKTCSEFGGIWASGTVSLTGGDADPEQLRAAVVTPNFFNVLGAECALGRTFRPEDSEPGASPTILLGWDLFERRFGADPTVIGRQILVNHQCATVIGIMPKQFRLMLPPDAAVPDRLQVWQPMGRDFDNWPRSSLYLRVIGRMRPGITLAQAQQEISGVAHRITEQTGIRRAFTTFSLHADGVRELRAPLLALFAGVTILLAIASVNVASLLTARALARSRETAVRLALGATRSRLARQCLVEGSLLTLLGLAAAWWVGWAGLNLLLSHLPESLSRISAAKIDVPVLAFTAGISVLWGLLFSLAPLIELRNVAPAASIDNRSSSLGRYVASGHHRRGVLVVLQIALSLVLLIGAGLMVRTFLNLQRAELGYRVDRRLTFRVALPQARYPSSEAMVAAMNDLRQRLASIPGMTSAGAISHLPFDDLPNWGLSYGRDATPQKGGAPFAHARAITPALLETIGVPLIEGRLFTEHDGQAENPVVIIDDVLAQRLWPDQRAVGQEFMLGQGQPDRRVSVIGVVRHVSQRSLVGDDGPQIFLPYRFWQRSPMAFVLRSDSMPNPNALVTSVRSAVARFDPNLPIYDVRPLEDYVEAARSTRHFTTLLATAFAVTALGLTCIGLYGLLSCAVALRQHEFGVRSALGAVPGQLRYQVLRETLRLAAVGCVVGIALALCVTSLLQSQLYGTQPWDPMTCGAAIGLVFAGATISSWIPAHRAAKISGMEALKRE